MTRQRHPDPLAGAAWAGTTNVQGRSTNQPNVFQNRRCGPSSSPRSGWLTATVAFLSFVRPSLQQHDPVADFCRRFGHQAAVVDNKLIIDGGYVNWNPITTFQQNYTNTWLSYHDLGAVASSGMPQLYANLSKNASIPNVDGGTLWSDDVNKRVYLFGGEYLGQPPSPFDLYAYDALYNQWNNLGSPSGANLMGVSFGAGTSVSARGEGYYYGGWMSNATIPGWSGPPVATANLVRFSYDTNAWVNTTGPDAVRRAEGVMVYVPVGDGGMLVYFGGVQDLYGNGTITGQPTNQIFLYDVLSGKWYVQNATGDVPPMRRRFCAGATWSQDQSSYNIYLYGGLGIPGFPNAAGFDDVYVLSLPSFTWIKMYPLDSEVTGDYPHHSLTCNVIANGAQMLVIGGTFPLSTDCDAATQWGAHNMDLGKQNSDSTLWAFYSPNKTSYIVPPEILSQIGGGPTGGATKTAPVAGFGSPDLKVLMTRRASVAARTPTRAIPSPTGAAGSGTALSAGAIAGVAVGGAAALLILAGVCFCVVRRHRRRHSLQRRGPPQGHGAYPDSHSVLGGGGGVHNMSNAAVWSPDSSHFSPGSPPYPPHSPFQQMHRPQTVPPHTGSPVELPVGPGGQYMPQQGGYFHEVPAAAPGAGTGVTAYGSVEQVKYDDQQGAWVPRTTTVALQPHQQVLPTSIGSGGGGGSPRHEALVPLTPASGGSGGGYGFHNSGSHVSSAGTETATSPLPLPVSTARSGVALQELDHHTGAGRDGGAEGPRHQTYYHP